MSDKESNMLKSILERIELQSEDIKSLTRGLRGEPENNVSGIVHQVKSVGESLQSIERDLIDIKIELKEMKDVTDDLKKFKSQVLKTSGGAAGLISTIILSIFEYFKIRS